MDDSLTLSNVILDSLNDGVYVCDRDRRIVYWNKAAERITGWPAEEVVGRRCLDDVLCHVDKDGHPLCGQEYCPLHRSMITDSGSNVPIIVYARSRSGKRIPMQVAVSPMRNASGEVIGGVETFRDMSSTLIDLERARKIQAQCLDQDLPDDPRLKFATSYTPHDIVGGDYFAIRRLDDNLYGFLLADVMGHGISAALYTMHLSSLWTRHGGLLARPKRFAAALSADLSRVTRGESFATATCGVIDASTRSLTVSSSGGPPLLVFHHDGRIQEIELTGIPFGVIEDASYDEIRLDLDPGDCLLLFSDGAYEIHDAQQKMLGIEGLIRILQANGYPDMPFRDVFDAMEIDLLKASNAIRLDDDLTFIEARFAT